MNKSEDFFEAQFSVSPVMAILRGFDATETVRLCNRAVPLEIQMIEIPVQDKASARSFAAAAEWGNVQQILIGAGTITSTALLKSVIDMGAAFTVAPGIREDVVNLSRHHNVPHLPGVATATEIQAALDLGCVWQKAFPASVLGPEWITAMQGPFPQVKFVATGGMTSANAAIYLASGARGISLGSSFATTPPEEIQAIRL